MERREGGLEKELDQTNKGFSTLQKMDIKHVRRYNRFQTNKGFAMLQNMGYKAGKRLLRCKEEKEEECQAALGGKKRGRAEKGVGPDQQGFCYVAEDGLQSR